MIFLKQNGLKHLMGVKEARDVCPHDPSTQLFSISPMPRRSKSARASKQNGSTTASKKPKTLTNQQIREILDWGYTVITYGKSKRTYVHMEEYSCLISDVQSMGSHIFNNADHGKSGDGTRLQLVREWESLPGKAAGIISRRIEASFPHLKPGDAQLLLSIADGHDQRPHTDVTAGHEEQLKDTNVRALNSHVQAGRVPLSVIVTFARASYLHVWLGSSTTIWSADASIKTEHEWSKRVTIPPFSALIFRQDLVHAGASYSADNLRLHFYMDLVADDYVIEKGHTFYVNKKFWRMSRSSKK